MSDYANLIPFAAEVVVAICGDLFFRDDLRGGRDGENGLGGRFGAKGLEVGGEFGLHLREVVFLDGTALGAEAEAVVLHFEEGDAVALAGERFVEDEDAGLHPGVGIETARGEGDDGDEGVLHEHLPQIFVGGLALEDDALGDDDCGAAGGGEVLGHVVYKENFAALGLDGETLVRLDAAFRRHEGRIGEDDVGEFVPAFFRGEAVIFIDVRSSEAVEVKVDQ